jgi:hypothetical protein
MFATFINLGVDVLSISRPPFWVSRWLGGRHWGLANWLSPPALHPRCSLVAVSSATISSTPNPSIPASLYIHYLIPPYISYIILIFRLLVAQ